MALTLADLIRDVKSRLGETDDTPAGQLDSGSGSVVQTTDQTITAYLNEAANDLARDVLPIPATATYTLAVDANELPIAAVADPSGRPLHAVRDVAIGGTALIPCAYEALRIGYVAFLNQPTGTAPVYWYTRGASIGVNQRQTSGTVISISGYALPVPMALTTDTLDTIPDGEAPALVFYAAAMIAARNTEDPVLAPRVAEWLAAYTDRKRALAARLALLDPETAAGFFPYAVRATAPTR